MMSNKNDINRIVDKAELDREWLECHKVIDDLDRQVSEHTEVLENYPLPDSVFDLIDNNRDNLLERIRTAHHRASRVRGLTVQQAGGEVIRYRDLILALLEDDEEDEE
jgi:hypothetical protein